ncbi:EFR1 family ferrodoxin [Anaerotignum sp. MB30-C6]|uniref:EFR1 family ferrodoxin n=1 Tax=Anaerotignum sp. MB30-C6 TaxID=3070814 RepID=UPI0027DDD7D6|nr:EFR1 family ferrodoxin [Anaerotignum sp. MB30-C6]WMI80834.1 EFR1 family ferrodoxin [Anaerotignum sp. MB30-C6]
MIFYFSGTGNSYATAQFLSDKLGEPIVDIAQATQRNETEYFLGENEKLGFVFPIYAWAPPKAVVDFVKRLNLHSEEQPYTFGVCTCGGSAGNAMDVLEDALKKKGIALDSGFSVVMPDNYIVMFKVKPLAKQEEILEEANETMERIAWAIEQEKRDFFRVKRGKGAAFLTTVIYPLFLRGGTKTKPFHVTSDCISCGLCEKVCTDGCIQMYKGVPRWMKEKCNMCLACANRCPKEAIQYGKRTKEKGRYIHPCWK